MGQWLSFTQGNIPAVVTYNTAGRRQYNLVTPDMVTAAKYGCVLVTDLGQKQQQPSLCVTKAIHVHDKNNIS